VNADPDQHSYVDGGRGFWILVPGGRSGVPVSTPEHEQLGPLPWPVRARVRTNRCGRPTLSGHPCRTPVARHGLTCAHHRSTARAS